MINIDSKMLVPDVFNRFNIKPCGIIHVGAHACEERCLYNEAGVPDERILWIEANPNLVENVKRTMPSSVHIIQGVVSDKEEDVSFMVTNNMQSSSILEFGTHRVQHPDVYDIGRMQLRTTTLPQLLQKHDISPSLYDFIAMDIQGAELHALRGMKDIIPNFNSIYLEVNTDEVYKGCGQLPEIEEFLGCYGFHLVEKVITSHGWGDALFMRN
jgi:FkbM family methyltransferase